MSNASIGIIGGADGPTAIFTTGNLPISLIIGGGILALGLIVGAGLLFFKRSR